MYKQRYIDGIGEEKIKEEIKRKAPLNIDGKTAKDLKINLALEHYIVKCYTSTPPLYEEKLKEYLKVFYNDFLKNPHKYARSPLIENDFLIILRKNGLNTEKIEKVRNEYYDSRSMNKLYNKKKTTQLTEEEKNRYYAYLLLIMNSTDESVKKVIEEEIDTIIKENKNKYIKDINTMELQFYGQYVSNYSKRLNNNKEFADRIDTIVMIGEAKPNLGGSENYDTIFMNKNTEYTNKFSFFTQCICHETQHAIQEHESKKEISKRAYEMALRNLFSKYLDYDSYHMNYGYESIELDAEYHGYFNARVFFSERNENELAEELWKRELELYWNRNDYNYKNGKNGKSYPTDMYIVYNIDNIIKNNPDEINNYPVLKMIYNEDGTKKTFKELLIENGTGYYNKRNIFDNYIHNGIWNNELEKLDIETFNKEELKTLFETLGNRFKDKSQIVLHYLNDENHTKDDKQVSHTTSYELGLVYIILKYIDKNYDKIIECQNDLNIKSSQHIIHNFLYDFRDFDLNRIKNKSLKNNSKVINELTQIKELTNKIIKKYNYTFIETKLNELSEDIKSQTLPNSNQTVYDYITRTLYPNMDSHQEISHNGKKYYVGHIIDNIKNSLTYSDKESNNSHYFR